MKDHNQKRILKKVMIISVLFLYVILLQVTKVYSPIAFLTNIPMPTTGMTRAWLSVLSLDFRQAFNYHGLFILGPLLAAYIFLYFKEDKDKYLNWSIGLALILFVYNIFRII